MIANYFKIALRNVLRKKADSILNIMGIAVGITASVLILYYVRFETSYDAFNKNAQNIYRVEVDIYREGTLESKSALTPPAVGQTLVRNYPEVQSVTRIASNPGKIIVLKEYFTLWVISTVIAIPAVYFYAKDWLDAFAFKIEMGPLVFGVPAIMLFLIIMMTVGMQSLAAASRNPAETIRAE